MFVKCPILTQSSVCESTFDCVFTFGNQGGDSGESVCLPLQLAKVNSLESH